MPGTGLGEGTTLANDRPVTTLWGLECGSCGQILDNDSMNV